MRFPVSRAAIGLLCGLGGAAVNLAPIPFLDTHLYLGSLFYIFAALAAGPWSGALAAGLAASVVAANGHPVPALSMCLEAVTLGWLVRRAWRPAFALLFFWAVLGLPLWLVTEWFNSGPIAVRWPVAPGFIVVSISSLLAARLLLMLAPLHSIFNPGSVPARPSLASLLSSTTMILAVLPFSFLGFWHLHHVQLSEMEHADRDLRQSSSGIAREVGYYLDTHVRAVATLARGIETGRRYDAGTITDLLGETRHHYPDFLTMLATDALGRVAAVSPRLDASADPYHVTGADLSGRPYFVAARDSGRPYISDVLPGRGLGHDAIVAISAPFRSADGSMVRHRRRFPQPHSV